MLITYLKQWYQEKFDSSEPAIFIVTVFMASLIIHYFGNLLAPLLGSIVIAYLLEVVVFFLSNRLKLNRNIAIYIVFLVFIASLFMIFFFVVPSLIYQTGQLIHNAPQQVNNLHLSLIELSEKYPTIITPESIKEIIHTISNIKLDKIAGIGQYIIKFSLTSLSSLLDWLIYLFIVPLLVFLLLKDKHRISMWFINILPKQCAALEEIWLDVRPQLGNYVKGKTIECVILTLITYIGFIVFDLNYSLLLSILVGISVFIPYIGMVIVTIPVIFIGIGQFGFSSDLFYMLLTYLVIQTLDGNLLVPLLYSEVLNLHPIAVITAVFFFGGIWGFWGIFFAIPLVTLINSSMKMWARHSRGKKDD